MNSARTDEPIKIADLFSGCGGFTQGFYSFRPAGEEGRKEPFFKSVLAIEKDQSAAATYAANFAPDDASRGHIHTGEIEHWQPTDEEISAEVVLGGPPCQGFSGLGKGDPDDPRNKLWRHYVRIVSEVIRPKIFVIENVDRFLSSPEFFDLVRETQAGGDLRDYRLLPPPGALPGDEPRKRNSRYLLNAADYGVRQARRRAIVIGVRKDVPEGMNLSYPEPTRRRPPWWRSRANAKDALFCAEEAHRDDEGIYWKTVKPIFDRSSEMDLKDDLSGGSGRYFLTTDLHFKRNPEILSLARYKAIPPGGNRKDLTGVWYKLGDDGDIHLSTHSEYKRIRGRGVYLSTESWDNHHNGSGDVMGRLRLHEPSVTIRTEFYKPEKGRYLHPTENRPITHFEAALIQGFPENFKWCGSKTEIARQIGNAVPIGLGREIARVIYQALRG
ncbi:DNA cytosine methyltransferase [Streptomyces sp. DH37]|uniref:DNA cytosine methyltransferase n=1 Tax=Streptomyces sp. DH37 TaxID=3040122 RepID=UPI0024432D7F|nr:DNA cytosine methyltransferase [Streptomyces sp. DH37]MDG9704959.1 DNA cytosine methyltransferase [Streptomyces sp. DH37]